MTSTDELYDGREHSQVKHSILRHYLERFSHIIGSRWDSITYIDGFSGPWNVASDDLSDSSFAIALYELRKARDTYQQQGRNLRLRCVFLEKDKQAFSQLKKYADGVRDVKILVKNDSFENSIKDVLRFIAEDKTGTFPFVFIDPCGTSGFAMDDIRPLIQLRPCEVLINFMTEFSRRFINTPITEEHFRRLYGTTAYLDKINGLHGQDRVDAMVDYYCERLRSEGQYQYTCPAIILHPDKARTYYHLIYATRHPKGVDAFKKAEKKAMDVQEAGRARFEKKKRESGGQLDLLFSDEPPPSKYYGELRQRYLDKATDFWLSQLQTNSKLAYDKAWEFGMALPMVWESDLKDWIKSEDHSKIRIEGLSPPKRVPKFGKGHVLVRDE